MAGVTAVTALNTFNGGFITASRFIYGTAREGSLPRQLAHLNDRAVPWVPVVDPRRPLRGRRAGGGG